MAKTKTDKLYTNSICNTCHWGDQCGEDNMKKCNFIDDIDKLDLINSEDDEYIDNMPIDEYLEPRRNRFNQEWMDYINYVSYQDWR